MKKSPIILFSLLILLTLSLSLTACNADALHASAPIRIKDPWLRWQPETGVGELYFYIGNAGEVDDALLSVSSEAAVETEMYVNLPGDEPSTIEKVSRIELPVDRGLILLPGGPHIKLIGLSDITPGQLIPITLQFEQAGEFSFYVEAR